ncbi:MULTISPECIES: hypothetical protein [Streptomyces]|uniref:hypothetical protein n=1 Tax=Streptomyces TaxID=1883 RepID=UPI000B9E05DB|nr:hypothetical protein [Streptomyces kasugaensis]
MRNNRNLKTMETTLTAAGNLAPKVSPDRVVVGESRSSTPRDLQRMAAAGITTFLVGESLMRAPDVEAAARMFLAK